MRSGDYKRLLDDLTEFMKRYVEYVGFHEPRQDYVEYYWVPRPGSETEIRQLHPRLALAAGRAAAAFETTGVFIAYKPSGTMNRMAVNPATAWNSFTDRFPVVTPPNMMDVGNQALGKLNSLYQQAKERERGLAGLVARFIRFPVAVREAAGLPPKTVSGGLLTGFVALVQTIVVGIVVAAIGGALAIPIAKYFGWM
jgi:hypothetical protein